MGINTVSLMGAGAIGSYFIYNMQSRMGNCFSVVAQGDRKERLEKDGLLINGSHIIPNVKTPQEAQGVDLLLITTKYDALKASLADIKNIIGPNTIVLSLLNGIDSEEIVESVIGPGHVLRSFIRIIANRKGREIHFDEAVTHEVYFGEEDGSHTERVQAICDLFDQTNIQYVLSDHIEEAQWNKFGVNISNNLPQAVFGVGYHAYFHSEHMKFIHQRVMDEFFAVANAKGFHIHLIPTPPEAAAPMARFSTLQDLDAKRHTEVDMFMGAFLKEAKKLGIAVPYCEYTYHAIKILEEKNDNLFEKTVDI
ncbi:MAG: 2-dehydropantoate 2-reductase [Eubacteriales bacterium]|nr:2-dehydropantoate 2-reductase [Eubacteriales bacterium]